MRSKWDILERMHWGGWNWLTCSRREGNIKQTPQPTLVVADSPKKGTINTERLKPFWEPRWLVCPSLPVSWQGSNCLVFLFFIDECVYEWFVFALCPSQFVCLSGLMFLITVLQQPQTQDFFSFFWFIDCCRDVKRISTYITKSASKIHCLP